MKLPIGLGLGSGLEVNTCLPYKRPWVPTPILYHYDIRLPSWLLCTSVSNSPRTWHRAWLRRPVVSAKWHLIQRLWGSGTLQLRRPSSPLTTQLHVHLCRQTSHLSWSLAQTGMAPSLLSQHPHGSSWDAQFVCVVFLSNTGKSPLNFKKKGSKQDLLND